MLISRTESKLQNLAAQIRFKNPSIQVKTVAVDLANQEIASTNDLFKDVEKSLEVSEPIGILVNNVAVNYEFPQSFFKTSFAEDEKIVQVNVVTVNRMTKMILPHMLYKFVFISVFKRN